MKPIDPRLVRHARATRTHLAVCVILGTATAVLVVAQAELLSRGIARAFQQGASATALTAVLAALTTVIVARAAVAWLQDGASVRASAAVKSTLRRAVVERAAQLGPHPEAARRRSEVATLATKGMDALDGYFGKYLPQLVLAVIVPIVVLVRLVPADLMAAVTVILTLPLIPFFMVLVGMATEAATRKRWNALNRLGHHFLDVLAGLPTLRLFGRARAQADAVRATTDQYRCTTMGTLRIAFLSSLVLELLATIAVALVAVGVGLRLVHGSLELQVGLLAIILAPEAYLPLRQVGTQYHAAADGLAAADHAFRILDAPTPATGVRTDWPDLADGATLRVEGLSVEHPGRRHPAPDKLDLEVRVGELVVVAGPSGSGKSTLLAALLGFVAPTSGQIVLDPLPSHLGDRDNTGSVAVGPVELSDLDLVTWRARLAWADQTPYLFGGSVADNVRLSDPNADDVRVRNALDAAGLATMPLERPIAERGEGLSAGERRRVALARALLRPVPLLLLDEPTAGLDPATEADVLLAVRRASSDRAVVMVSHRPAALGIADRVVELRMPTTRDVVAGADRPGGHDRPHSFGATTP